MAVCVLEFFYVIECERMADKATEENRNPTQPPEIKVTSEVASGGSAAGDAGKKGVIDTLKTWSPVKRRKCKSPESPQPSTSEEGTTSKLHKVSPVKIVMDAVSHFIHPIGGKGTDQGYQKLQEEGRERRKSSKGVELSISPTHTDKKGANVEMSETSSSVSSASSESLDILDD